MTKVYIATEASVDALDTRLDAVEAALSGFGGIEFDAQVISSSLADLANQQTTIAISPYFTLFHVATSHAARVRLYASTAQQAADVARDTITDPTGNHGVILDLQTTGGTLAFDITPAVAGAIPSGSSNVPCTITNMSGVTRAITVDASGIR